MKSLPEILEIVCDQLNLTPEEVKQKSRKQELVNARRAFMLMATKNTTNTYAEIAQTVELNDHSTVGYHVKTAEDYREWNTAWRVLLDEIEYKVICDSLEVRS